MSIFDHKSGTFIKNDGADIYYETAGHSDKYPIILLHGGMGKLKSPSTGGVSSIVKKL